MAEWSDGTARPARRDGANAVRLDDDLALYDDAGRLLILLNTSAATVWELCDGTTTLDEMVRTLADAYPEEAAVIADDVRLTVRKLAELGLVAGANDAVA
jgi:coenzyme PQQ synthesis protein D (PqqD)